MKRYIIYLLLILMCTEIAALPIRDSVFVDSTKLQSRSLMKANNRSLSLPEHRETIHSPQVALMNQYGNYPVDLSNGLVDISIPIYEIKTKGLTMPISLSFHASGLRADEREGALGVRWVLNTGGVISRIIKGYPDDDENLLSDGFANEVNNPYFTPDFYTFYGATQYLKEHLRGPFGNQHSMKLLLGREDARAGRYNDAEHDIFSYHLPTGKRGKFILQRIGLDEYSAVTLPYEPVKIKITKNASKKFSQFQVTDENGVEFTFGGANRIDEDIDWNHIAWHLHTIVSADKQDTIFINYKKIANGASTSSEGWYDSYDDNNFFGEYFYPDEIPVEEGEKAYPGSELYWAAYPHFHRSFDYNIQYIHHYSSNLQVESINFAGGTINFIYQKFSKAIYREHDYLERIEISNKINVVKNVGLSYLTNRSNVKFLNQVDINGQKYNVEYYEKESYPDDETMPSNTDWWGYYTGSTIPFLSEEVQRTISPPLVFNGGGATGGGTSMQVSSHIRGQSSIGSTSVNSMKIGMVKSIKYPTGGQSDFEYESNYYKQGYEKIHSLCGGLRIKEIINKLLNGLLEVKRYSYNKSTNGAGEMPQALQQPNNQRTNFFDEKRYELRVRTYNITHEDLGVGYYIISGGDYIHRRFSNKLPSNLFDYSSKIVYYSDVTENIEYINPQESKIEKLGKTEYDYYYNLPEHTFYTHSESYDMFRYMQPKSMHNMHIAPPQFGQTSNRLHSKTEYKEGSSTPLRKQTFIYRDFNKGEMWDMAIKQYRIYSVSGYDPHPGSKEVEIELIYNSDPLLTYGYVHKQYILGAERLAKEITEDHTDAGIIRTTKEYNYDPTYLLPIEEKITGSSGDVFVKKFKHPFDYKISPYLEMCNKNILSPIVEVESSKNNVFLEKMLTNYKQWRPGVFSPLNVQLQKKGANLETRLTYNFDNNYNFLQEVQKDNSDRIIYLRNAYNQPVAEILNTTYQEVAKQLGQSFIDDISHKFILTESDMSKINSLRGKMSNTQITTYTYRPLVGIISITSPTGVTTYYKYDAFSRLEHIKDAENNIVEEYKYHYSNQ